MVFAKRLREGVVRGEITCTIRIWTSPHVKEGGRYSMGDGAIEIESEWTARRRETRAAEVRDLPPNHL